MRPGDGWKSRSGSSALMRHSMAWPRIFTSSWVNPSGSPPAMRSCSWIRSTPVTISVTVCSTWMRALTSMK